MFTKIRTYISNIENIFDGIPPERKEQLNEVAGYIQSKLDSSETAKLNFICTHNSRRSHLTQIWTATAANYYGIRKIETYSGGTEATAFNPRAVAAIERAGFQVVNPGGTNSRYEISFNDESEPMICYSKKFDDEYNPSKNFAAIMTCSDADVNCPFVPGAEFRKPITYRDPKESDGSSKESEVYDERCLQIATEMFYMMNVVHKNLRNK